MRKNIDVDDDDIKVWERSFLITHAEGFVNKGELQLVRWSPNVAGQSDSTNWWTSAQQKLIILGSNQPLLQKFNILSGSWIWI